MLEYTAQRFAERAAQYANPYSVGCPYCRARPGHPCPNRRRSNPHHKRVQDARAATRLYSLHVYGRAPAPDATEVE